MLEPLHFDSPETKLNWYKTLAPRESTVIVSDLKSKLYIQQIFLNHSDCIEQDSVLRISDFWQQIQSRCFAEYQLISTELAELLIADFIDLQCDMTEFGWAKAPGTEKAVIEFMQNILPMISHPDQKNLMHQWFLQNPSQFQVWGDWYKLCEKIWFNFVGKKLIVRSWLAGFLYNQIPTLAADQLSLKMLLKKKIFVDLGPHLRFVECELLKEISRLTLVQVLISDLPKGQSFQKPPSVYEAYFSIQPNLVENPYQFHENTKFYRFTSRLSEVKNCVGHIRKILDLQKPNQQKILPDEIAIVAPDIGVYWDSLQAHLVQEGIPLQREKKISLQSLPAVHAWLSSLRVRCNELDANDLQTSYFYQEEPKVAYDQFQALFNRVYDRLDLNRKSEVAEYFLKQDKSYSGAISLIEFLSWASLFWLKGQNAESLQQIIQAALQTGPLDTRLKKEKWLLLISDLCAAKELMVEPTRGDGVHCIDLESSEFLQAKVIFLLGVDEASLQQNRLSFISANDILSIYNQTGVALQMSDSEVLEFQARWLCQKENCDIHISYSAYNFDGNPQAPSLFWLAGARPTKEQLKIFAVPAENRWQQLQQSDWSHIQSERKLSNPWLQRMQERMQEDMGKKSLENFAQKQVKNFSATTLEHYAECPFIYASERIFKLTDLPEVDLDVDHMTRGSLMHKVCAQICKEPFRTDLSKKDLEQMVDLSAKELELPRKLSSMWPLHRSRYLNSTFDFYEFEKKWRLEFPQTRTMAIEKRLEVAADVENTKFTGVIDRMDMDQDGNAIVIDYKSSESDWAHSNKWLEKHQYQLAMYTYLAENNNWSGEFHNSDKKLNIVGAQYFNLQDKYRNKGYALKDLSSQLVPQVKKYHLIETDEKKQLMLEMQKVWQDLGEKMVAGEFAPRPSDEKNCIKCKWKPVCRYHKAQ